MTFDELVDELNEMADKYQLMKLNIKESDINTETEIPESAYGLSDESYIASQVSMYEEKVDIPQDYFEM